MQLLDTTATIETPERVRFQYRIAGPGPRAMAWMVDVAVQLVFVLALVLVSSLVTMLTGLQGAGTGLVLLGLFVLQWLYGAILETAFGGQTPGKRVFNLRVVRADGSPAGVQNFMLRNLLRAVDFLPALFGIGVLTMLIDRRMRRIGDLVGGTMVVLEQDSKMFGSVSIEPPVTEEERQSMPVRVDLSNEEVRVIEDFLRRRSRMSDARAEELAHLLGPAITERSGLEAPTWERVLTLAYARATGRDREPT